MPHCGARATLGCKGHIRGSILCARVTQGVLYSVQGSRKGYYTLCKGYVRGYDMCVIYGMRPSENLKAVFFLKDGFIYKFVDLLFT